MKGSGREFKDLTESEKVSVSSVLDRHRQGYKKADKDSPIFVTGQSKARKGNTVSVEGDRKVTELTDSKNGVLPIVTEEDKKRIRSLKKMANASFKYSIKNNSSVSMKTAKLHLTELEKYGISHTIENDRLVIDTIKKVK